MSSAFASRTLPKLKQARVHPMAMAKWWKKKRPSDGEVRRRVLRRLPVVLGPPSPPVPTKLV